MQRKPTKQYMRAYGALYGKNTALDLTVPKTRKKPSRDEEVEQEKFNNWFDEYFWNKGYRWFHPANGGSRGSKMINGKWVAIEGFKMKRMGVKRGVPDILIPMARKSFHGLAIELKRIDGKMSDVSSEQVEWLNWFKGQQWSAHVAFGFEQAKQIVVGYFS